MDSERHPCITSRRAGPAWRLGVALSLVVGAAASSGAQPTTDRPASILFFPRVVADASTDTLIQLGNSGNNSVSARCFYIAGDTCSQTEFFVSLPRQQPTHWVASRGRAADPNDIACSAAISDCDGAGHDPGEVPSLPDGFQGLLACVETDAAHNPVSGNHLVGEASLVDKVTGDVSQYTAVGLEGNPETNDGNSTLCLGGGVTEACPSGAEYDGCPDVWAVNFLPDGAADPVVGGSATVSTHFVVVPCARNLDTNAAPGVIVQMLIYNEHATRLATSKAFGCWTDTPISLIDTRDGNNSIFGAGFLGDGAAQAQLRGTNGGMIVLPYEIHHSGDLGDASAAADAHALGVRAQADLVVLPDAGPPP